MVPGFLRAWRPRREVKATLVGITKFNIMR
jgi:hypothetical protein